MHPRYTMSRSYYDLVKSQAWPTYEDFNLLDLDSSVIADLGDHVSQEIEEYISQEFKYHHSLYPMMKHQFPGLEQITEHYSEQWQDLFVLTMLDGKKNGTFVELGAAWPTKNNNSCLLSEFGYRGISVEKNTRYENEWRGARPNDVFLCQDALKIDYATLLTQQNFPTQIDYLQIDIDNEIGSLELIDKLIASGKHRFSVITLETNLFFSSRNKKFQDDSYQMLKDLGYQLVVKNVGVREWDTEHWRAFEDWYVDPSQIDADIISKVENTSSEVNKPHKLLVNDSHMKGQS